MMRLSSCVVAAALAVASTGSHAQAAEGAGLPGTVLSFLHGTCVKLVVAGKDRTAECKPSLINAGYPSGNSSFMFPVGEAMIVSFFGKDNPAVGNKSLLYLSKVSVRVGAKEDSSTSAVQGTCSYTNPYIGTAQITCQADSAKGAYSVEFISDGKAPETVKL